MCIGEDNLNLETHSIKLLLNGSALFGHIVTLGETSIPWILTGAQRSHHAQ